jgi:hypothetical protein
MVIKGARDEHTKVRVLWVVPAESLEGYPVRDDATYDCTTKEKRVNTAECANTNVARVRLGEANYRFANIIRSIVHGSIPTQAQADRNCHGCKNGCGAKRALTIHRIVHTRNH